MPSLEELAIEKRAELVKILKLRCKVSELFEQTSAFFKEHTDENGMFEASAMEQYEKMTDEVIALCKELQRLEGKRVKDKKQTLAKEDNND